MASCAARVTVGDAASRRAQSAMEYLASYGWAILVIAIVLAALVASGIFTQSPPNLCLAPAEFECRVFLLFGMGAYNITIAQELSAPINITAIGCNMNETTRNMMGFKPEIYLPTNGQVTITGNSLGRGFCFSGSGLFTGPIGTVFHGYVMINYTNLFTGFKHTVAIEVTQKVLNMTPPLSTTTSTTTSLSTTTTTTTTSTSTTSTTTTTTTSTTTTASATTIQYVPVTLTSSAGTDKPFQQMVVMNSQSYTGLMANLSNVEFTQGGSVGGGGTPLQAWCETNCSSSSTRTLMWVLLPNGVPASPSNVVIDMNLMPSNSPVLNGYTGYAPQRYCASGCIQTGYGQHDNGASVFTTLYQDFNGTSQPNGWTVHSAMQNNGITETSGSYVVSNNNYGLSNYLLEFYGFANTASSYAYFGYATSQGLGGKTSHLVIGLLKTYSNVDYTAETQLNGGSTGISVLPTTVLSTEHLFSAYWPSASMDGIGIDYNTLNNVTENVPSAALPAAIEDTGGTTLFAQWVRIRSYPPNGIMPSTQCGPPLTSPLTIGCAPVT